MKKRRKQRVLQHIMEEQSYLILKKYISEQHIVREFNKPDYGIDLVIELANNKDYEPLGEFVFVQVKSIKKLAVKTEKIFSVKNVSKGILEKEEEKEEEIEIDVVKFLFDTTSLYSIQKLGASVSVLLFVVDFTTENVYYLCINDYIDKIILPNNPNYTKQKKLTLKIPAANNLKNNDRCVTALRFYGKRAKLLAAFSKFYYQKNELCVILDSSFYSEDSQIAYSAMKQFIEQVLFYIEQIEELDIWDFNEWNVLPILKQEMIDLKNYLKSDNCDLYETKYKVISYWNKLTNLNVMYEELARELFLPKMISELIM